MDAVNDYGDVFDKWAQARISREDLKALMQRSDAKGLVHAALFYALLIGLGIAAYWSIGKGWWMIPIFWAYGTVYCFQNHLMHETHHRTAFKSTWLNETFHWISGFFHGEEPVYARWGHAQHHTYTYMPDHDPEIMAPRPAQWKVVLPPFFGIGVYRPIPIIKHAFGILSEADRELVPESDQPAMIRSARGWLLGYGLIIASCIVFQTWLPLVFTVFARFYGAFIPTALNHSQHFGLEQDVYDHRLCSRNIRLNPLLGFLYWNMQYHIEHHMYPAIPFHALRKMHLKIRDQLPASYPSLIAAYREMVPIMLRQQRDPDYHLTPKLPASEQSRPAQAAQPLDIDIVREGDEIWISVPEAETMAVDDVLGFKHEGEQYAIYRLKDGYYATSNRCSHAGALLSKGFVIDEQIECPAHQGRFDIRSGEATHSPACKRMKTFPIKQENGRIMLGIRKGDTPE